MLLFCTFCNYLVVFPREFLGAHHHVVHAPTTKRHIPSADELCRTAGVLSSVPPEQPMALLSSLQLAVVHIVFMTDRSFTDVDAH